MPTEEDLKNSAIDEALRLARSSTERYAKKPDEQIMLEAASAARLKEVASALLK